MPVLSQIAVAFVILGSKARFYSDLVYDWRVVEGASNTFNDPNQSMIEARYG